MATEEPNTRQLSEPQKLALEQYRAVTDQDVGAAIPLLQRSQWNVEVCPPRGPVKPALSF